MTLRTLQHSSFRAVLVSIVCTRCVGPLSRGFHIQVALICDEAPSGASMRSRSKSQLSEAAVATQLSAKTSFQLHVCAISMSNTTTRNRIP